MTTYRVGNHHGVTIVREGDGHRCDLDGHDCARGHLVGVMLTAEDAAQAVEALNGTPASQAAARCAKCGNALAACQDCGKPAQCGEPWCVDCQPEEGWLTSETVSAATIADVMAIVDAPYQPGIDLRLEGADSCTCPPPAGPLCPVHQGRRARGPKPPPVGPGCICDGSGRTCPRHGAVI